jgi:hypothetical protein
LKNCKWERPNIELPIELNFVRLVCDEGKGKMYLIGGIGRNGISKSMKIWELCEGKNWVEIESVPEMMCRKIMAVCYHNYEHLYCFWHQGLICVCCYAWPEILYYKVSRRTWHWLPKSPSVPDRWVCGFMIAAKLSPLVLVHDYDADVSLHEGSILMCFYRYNYRECYKYREYDFLSLHYL